MAKEQKIKVGTINVKNIETNVACVRELLKTCDILALHEYWLSHSSMQILKTYLTHIMFIARLYMTKTPCRLTRNQKPRGYGGVAVLYRKHLVYKVKHYPTERIEWRSLRSSQYPLSVWVMCIYLHGIRKATKTSQAAWTR